MNTDKLNQKIAKANKKFTKAEKKQERGVKRKLSSLALKDLKLKVEEERRETYSLISQKLKYTNSEYKELARTQVSKYSRNLSFKKYKESAGLVISAINSFSGFLYPNGHIYCEGTFSFKTSFSKIIEPLFFNQVYPKRMEGTIDALGNVSLRVVQFGWALFNTMPEEFTSRIEENGKITITTKTRSSDVAGSHRSIIHKIISSFAFESTAVLQEFMETRNRLHELIEQERATL